MTQAHRKDSTLEKETPEATSARAGDLLDRVDTPLDTADLTLTSGRRYELRADGDRDQVTIRSAEGNIVLRIEVTDAGPVLSFSGASIDLVAKYDGGNGRIAARKDSWRSSHASRWQ
jgi:hypothetical protein